jgi:hypothetical protein
MTIYFILDGRSTIKAQLVPLAQEVAADSATWYSIRHDEQDTRHELSHWSSTDL